MSGPVESRFFWFKVVRSGARTLARGTRAYGDPGGPGTGRIGVGACRGDVLGQLSSAERVCAGSPSAVTAVTVTDFRGRDRAVAAPARMGARHLCMGYSVGRAGRAPVPILTDLYGRYICHFWKWV